MDVLLNTNTWNLGELYPNFVANDINDLDTLSEFISHSSDEMKREIIPTIGLLLRLKKKFREHLENPNNFSKGHQVNSIALAESTLAVPCDDSHTSADPLSSIDDKSICSSVNISDLEIVNQVDLEEPQEFLIVNSTPKIKKSSKLLTFDLKEVLREHPIGNALLSISSHNISLEAQWQSHLCEIIVVHFLKLKVVLVNEDFERISIKIVEIFPNECTQTYYVPAIKKKDSKRNKCEIAKGKLVDKWRNIQTLIRTLQNLSGNPLEGQDDEIQPCSPLDSKEWLVNNRDEADILVHWESSHDLRRAEVSAKRYKTASDIFNDWPILKETIGCQLIHNDFKKIYAGKENALIANWDNIFSQILKIFHNKLSEENKRKLQYLQLSDQHITRISKCVIQLEILAVLLAPKINKNKFKKVESGRKPALELPYQEIINSICLHVRIPGDIQKILDDRTVLMTQLKKTIQPFLIVVGQDKLKLEKVYVQIDNFRYEISTFLNGLGTLFELFLIFNIAYPVESQNIWYFFQWGIYQITTKSDTQIPLVYTILNKLKQTAKRKM